MTAPLSRRQIIRAGGIGLGAGAAATLAGVTGANAQPIRDPQLMAGKSGPFMTAYVEVNNNSIANVGKYTLANSGAPAFDIAIIFAANINYDGQKAVLYNNPQVQTTLNEVNTRVRPLQAKGIKVLLSILGNHQGAGICNFQSYAEADVFAKQLADTVYKYGLDGIDFDDEYSEYGVNGTGQPNAYSFIYLIQALRQRMPDKIISLYWYGPVQERVSYNGVNAGSYLNYSWNALYGTYIVPGVPGLSKAQLAPAAIEIPATGSATAQNLASRTVSDGYGGYLTYNLPSTNQSAYISGITQRLYGENTVYTP